MTSAHLNSSTFYEKGNLWYNDTDASQTTRCVPRFFFLFHVFLIKKHVVGFFLNVLFTVFCPVVQREKQYIKMLIFEVKQRLTASVFACISFLELPNLL